MDALNKSLAQLEAKQQAIQEKKRTLDREEYDLARERRHLEEERLRLSRKMTPQDEETLKKELTAAGELLELQAVIHGSLRVLSEDPDDPEEFYSIDIQCGTCEDTGVTGLYANVTVKTTVPRVETIVRELFEQEGSVEDRSLSALSWEKNWDYYTRIKLTSHEALAYG
jgi:hypothetical protein